MVLIAGSLERAAHAEGRASPAEGRCEGVGGIERRALVVGGLRRTYLVAAPGRVRGSAPILLAFHGYSRRGEILAATSRLATVAGPRGFLTVFPDGTGRPSRWSIPGRLAGPDDVAFVDALVADLARRSCGDASRVYAAGFSNGAAFVGLLACRRPELLDGIAFISGANLADPCAATSTPVDVPVVLVHGAADRVVALAGGPVIGGALQAEPFTATVDRWRQEPGRRLVVNIVAGRGHTWPPLANEQIAGTFAS